MRCSSCGASLPTSSARLIRCDKCGYTVDRQAAVVIESSVHASRSTGAAVIVATSAVAFSVVSGFMAFFSAKPVSSPPPIAVPAQPPPEPRPIQRAPLSPTEPTPVAPIHLSTAAAPTPGSCSYDRVDLAQTLFDQAGAARGCLIGEAPIELALTINRGGRVLQATSLTAPLPTTERDCVLRAARAWRFPGNPAHDHSKESGVCVVELKRN